MKDASSNQISSVAGARFAELYEPVAPRLWAWVSVRLGPTLRAKVDVQDVLQEVACRAWRRFDTFDNSLGTFEQWSLGIARRTLGELLTRMARGHEARAGWSTASWDGVPDRATRVTVRVARSEHRALLLGWLDELNEDDRRMLLYRGLESWTHADVAEFLGIGEEAAKKRWARLVERIRTDPRLAALVDPNQRP